MLIYELQPCKRAGQFLINVETIFDRLLKMPLFTISCSMREAMPLPPFK